MSEEIERCILVKNEVFVYKIPPRASARGYRAADWNLTAPDWTGRLRVVTGGKVKNLFFTSRKIRYYISRRAYIVFTKTILNCIF